MGLRAAYWSMHRGADACLAPSGVTANQFVLLALLAEEGGVSQRVLGDRASSDANTVGAMLVALEDKGLVERNRDVRDGRARKVSLTGAGRCAYGDMWEAGRGFRGRLESVFGPGEREQFLDLLSRVAAATDPRADRDGEPADGGPARTSTSTRPPTRSKLP